LLRESLEEYDVHYEHYNTCILHIYE
jgi:hypothetical protein